MTSKPQKPVKKPASDVEKLAKAITRRDASVKWIDIRYAPTAKRWYAKAMPESFIVHRTATEELKSLNRSTTMDELGAIYAKHEQTPLASVSGATPEEALKALHAALPKFERD